MKTYLPNSDAEFANWAQQYVDCTTKNPETYQLSATEIKELQREFAAFQKDYEQAIAQRDAAQAAVTAKDEARKQLEQLVRGTARRIQADNRVTDQARRVAGLPIHKTTKTPVPAPKTVPIVEVKLTAGLEHTVVFQDSEGKRRRPVGTIGVEVYMLVSDDTCPGNIDEYTFVGVCSRSPKLMTFDPKDANKVAHYVLRWVNHKGETGPWSAPASGTIPAV